MENIVLGLLAQVDRGKTSLSESLLFESGKIEKKGRVDHGDSVLDHDELERKKGITIYAKSVYFSRENKRFFLLDTPGHREFSGEMERALKVLDYGILLLDGKEGIGGRERELWSLAGKAGLPLFLFVNKMDLWEGSRESLMEELRAGLPGEALVDFTPFSEENGKEARTAFLEEVSLSGTKSMEEYLEKGNLSIETIRGLMEQRLLFPVFFGSALKQEGIDAFLRAVTLLCETRERKEKGEKAGYIYKITRDEKGRRIAKARLFKGNLSVREEWIPGEKLTEIRMEEGDRYTDCSAVEEGSLFLAPVSEKVRTGAFPCAEEGRRAEKTYFEQKLSLKEGDILRFLPVVRALSEEFPEWGLGLSEEGKTVRIRSLGALQKELLRTLFLKRTGEELVFSDIEAIYGEGPRKTAEAEGLLSRQGHFFSLRLRLSPLTEGQEKKEEGETEKKKEEETGEEQGEENYLLQFAEGLSLKEEWRNRLETEWREASPKGMLLSGPYTEYKVELLDAEYKESASYYIDFKEAFLEAFSEARRISGTKLFYPLFAYRITTEAALLGDILQRIEKGKGKQEELLQEGETVRLAGKIPGENLPRLLKDLQDFGAEVRYRFQKFLPMGEEEERTLVEKHFLNRELAAQLLYGEEVSEEIEEQAPFAKKEKKKEKSGSYIQDATLEEIFVKTFGPIRNRGKEALLSEQKLVLSREKEEKQREARAQYEKKTVPGRKAVLLVDGYNFMFADAYLKELAGEDLMAGREKVITLLSEYAVYQDTEVYLIFDAYHVKGHQGSSRTYGKNLESLFTKEGETADFQLTKMAKDFAEKGRRVSIVTSDRAVQVQAFSGKGVRRYSSREFYRVLEAMRRDITASLEE